MLLTLGLDMEVLTVERLKKANEIVKRIKLPVQPKIVIDINKEACAEEPDFRKIGQLVSMDAGLSAKVLHVINSPFFGISKEVTSIVQSLSLMGMENFTKVILTTCLREAIGSSSNSDEIFWDHSLRTAVAAEYIAKQHSSVLSIDGISPDQAYMTGLFHDSAIPLFIERTPEYGPTSFFALSHKADTVQLEEQVIGTDHCCVGAMMAKSWSLPTQICKAILHHHAADYTTIVRDQAPLKLIAVLQLADYLAYTYDYSIGGSSLLIENDWSVDEWCHGHELVLDALHLTADEVTDLKMDVFDKLSQ